MRAEEAVAGPSVAPRRAWCEWLLWPFFYLLALCIPAPRILSTLSPAASAASSHGSVQWEREAPPAAPHWPWVAAVLRWLGLDGGGAALLVTCLLRVLLRGLQRVPCSRSNHKLAYLQWLSDEEALSYLVSRFREYLRRGGSSPSADTAAAIHLANMTVLWELFGQIGKVRHHEVAALGDDGSHAGLLEHLCHPVALRPELSSQT